jgi:hypothetical protein
MITTAIIIVLAILGADAIYSRARLTLRRRASTQPQRPAFDLVRPSGGGWRPIDERANSADGPDAEDGADLSRLFGQGRR